MRRLTAAGGVAALLLFRALPVSAADLTGGCTLLVRSFDASGQQLNEGSLPGAAVGPIATLGDLTPRAGLLIGLVIGIALVFVPRPWGRQAAPPGLVARRKVKPEPEGGPQGLAPAKSESPGRWLGPGFVCTELATRSPCPRRGCGRRRQAPSSPACRLPASPW